MFPVLLSNTNNSIQYLSLVWTQLNGLKCSKLLNISIWTIDRALIGATASGQSGPESNGNEEVLNNSQSSRTRSSPSDNLLS